jgi:hypothetical protein
MKLRTNLLVAALLVTLFQPLRSLDQAVKSSNPTLAETMAFLNEKFQQRGALQVGEQPFREILSSESFSGAGCEQTYRLRADQRYNSDEETEQITVIKILRLDQADLSSVAILEPDKSRTGFAIAVNKIAFSDQLAYHLKPTQEVKLSSDIHLNGAVMSVDATSVTLLPNNSGIPQRVTPDGKTVVYMGFPAFGTKSPKAKLGDISPGDEIIVFVRGKSPSIYIKKVPGAVAPKRPDPEAILPATRQISSERKQFVFGYVKDRDDAEHLAKAMIHAIVLCQVNAKKELF